MTAPKKIIAAYRPIWDLYAAAALPAVLATAKGYPVDAKIIAQGAALIADALLLEREKRNG